MLRGKAKLKIIEVLIKSLIDSYIGHGEFVSLNNALRKYNEMKEEIKKICGKDYVKMVNISREMSERNAIEAIVDNDGILRLNEKHIEEGLDHKHLWEIAIKHHSDHRKLRYELLTELKINAIEFL